MSDPSHVRLGPSEKIKHLQNGKTSQDGQNISFEIVTADGAIHAFWQSTKDVEKFIRYLIDASQYALRKEGKLQAPATNETVTVYPIESVALAIAPGRASTECMLTVHLGSFHLTFAIDASAVYGLRHTIQQLVPVEKGKPQ